METLRMSGGLKKRAFTGTILTMESNAWTGYLGAFSFILPIQKIVIVENYILYKLLNLSVYHFRNKIFNRHESDIEKSEVPLLLSDWFHVDSTELSAANPFNYAQYADFMLGTNY